MIIDGMKRITTVVKVKIEEIAYKTNLILIYDNIDFYMDVREGDLKK